MTITEQFLSENGLTAELLGKIIKRGVSSINLENLQILIHDAEEASTNSLSQCLEDLKPYEEKVKEAQENLSMAQEITAQKRDKYQAKLQDLRFIYNELNLGKEVVLPDRQETLAFFN